MLRVMIANSASTMMTTVIAVTTAEVVRADRLSVFGRTLSPKWQAIRAIRRPKKKPLPIPIQTLATGTARGKA